MRSTFSTIFYLEKAGRERGRYSAPYGLENNHYSSMHNGKDEVGCFRSFFTNHPVMACAAVIVGTFIVVVGLTEVGSGPVWLLELICVYSMFGYALKINLLMRFTASSVAFSISSFSHRSLGYFARSRAKPKLLPT